MPRKQDLQRELGEAVRLFQIAVDAFDDAVAVRAGLHRTDLRCVDVLLHRGRATSGALATEMGLTSGSVTAMVDRLERSGHVRRERDTEDRRRVFVVPTDRAHDLERTYYHGIVAARTAPKADAFTVAELEVIVRFLDEATDAYRLAFSDVQADEDRRG